MERERALSEKLRQAGLPPAAIDAFVHYYRQLAEGETGLIPETSIEPVDPESLPAYADLESYVAAGRATVSRAVVIKLNGGLGTTMGLDRTKSLIVVRDGLSFLEITIRRVLRKRQRLAVPIPLLLMNSFRTDEETRQALVAHPELATDLPTTFVQHRFPRLLADTLEPVSCPEDPDLEWSPPGHGDLFPALVTSGLLTRLLSQGVRFAFVTNIDNLGGAFDLGLLGYMAEERQHFVMEVAERTPMDRKGGHLARRRRDGALVLREVAQCPEDDRNAFQDIRRHRLFNTNNLWLDLAALQETLTAQGGVLRLPLIRNLKRLDPRAQDGPEVFQLESAVGAAISAFPRASAVRVPRSRFTPVKSCDDLLLTRSDYFHLSEDFVLARSLGARSESIRVQLDPRFYGRLDRLEERFPFGPPSLVECESFSVRGDVRFGRNVVARGHVVVQHPDDAAQGQVPDGAVLAGDL